MELQTEGTTQTPEFMELLPPGEGCDLRERDVTSGREM